MLCIFFLHEYQLGKISYIQYSVYSLDLKFSPSTKFSIYLYT
jgi:hypothetical protein